MGLSLPRCGTGLSVIPEVFPGSDHLGCGYIYTCLPGQVCAFVRFLASALTPHLVPGSATSTSSLSRLRASWVLPLHNSEVERSLRGSPREEPWSDLLGQQRVGWGGPPGCTPPPPSMGWKIKSALKTPLAWTLVLPVFCVLWVVDFVFSCTMQHVGSLVPQPGIEHMSLK